MPGSKRSAEAYERAKRLMPGGVNSPVRAFRGVGGTPRFIDYGEGPYLYDIDGNRYLDFVCSWGAILLGHAHPEVTDAICAAAKRGSSFGAPTEAETDLAEWIVASVPSVEMVRLVNSGTEATMSAVRLARGFTKRDLIVKFEGCYHGHGDSFLIAAGSGALTFGTPDSAGVTSATAANTLVAKFNDIDSVCEVFEKYGEKIAACIVEPVAGNMGVIPPREGFLKDLREVTKKWGALLIFDEVISGFRLGLGGAQERYSVFPDITTLGKIIGGGMPIGAYGGSREIMEHVAPEGPVYQAGTLSGNPPAVSAGLTALKIIRNTPDFYGSLEKKAARLAQGIEAECRSLGIPAVLNRVGSMMTLFFTERNVVENYSDAKSCDTKKYGKFFHSLLEEGIYLPPSQFEAMFVSASHREADINLAIEKFRSALIKVKEQG